MQYTDMNINNKEISFKKEYFTTLLISLFVFGMYAFSDNQIFSYSTSLLVIIFLFFTQIKEKKITTYFYWGFWLCSINLASVIWAADQSHAFEDSLRIIIVFIVCALTSMWIDSVEKLHKIFGMIIISSFVMSVRILLEVPVSDWGNRFSWIFGVNVNPISMKTMFSALLALYFFYIEKRKKWKVLYLLYIAFSLGIVLLLGSRRAIFLFIISYFLFILFIQKNKLKPIIYSIILAGIVYFLLMNIEILYEIVGERIELTINSFFAPDAIDMERNSLARMGIDLFTERPVFGWGANNFEVVSGMGMYSHNNYVELLANTGVIGFMIYYSIHIKALINSGIRNKLDVLLLVIILTILFSDFAAPSYSVLYMHFFICMILAYQENIKGKLTTIDL